MQWLSGLAKETEEPDVETVNRALAAYVSFWKNGENGAPKLHDSMAEHLARMVREVGPVGLDSGALRQAEGLLRRENHHTHHADTLAQAGAGRDMLDKALLTAEGFLGHFVFWALLVLVYPRSPRVQAFFFWNPWIRKLLGFGYVGVLLTWVPPLRNRLLAPFRPALLADAQLDAFTVDGYFKDSLVELPDQSRRPLVDELATLRGQVLLEGDSGLGKTWFLRYHLKQSRRLAVFLPAQRCAQGLLAAIRSKLQGYAQDETFLKSLVYSGGLDIYVDGLNEVSPDIRAGIKTFAEEYFRANLLLTAQPMKWEPPSSARRLILQPLDVGQMRMPCTFANG